MENDVFAISRRLNHYKRRDVQEEMVLQASDREVGIRFGEGGFGSRPDILTYPADIMEAAKRGATSFHCSEERWNDPLLLEPGMRPAQFAELRTGWDLVLDVDCKVWDHAKIVTDLLVKALESQGIRSISCKFSGNKGFHIGVPFEAFPAEVHGRPIAEQFPDGVHWIARYLAFRVDSREMGHALTKSLLKDGEEALAKQLALSPSELLAALCAKCGQPRLGSGRGSQDRSGSKGGTGSTNADPLYQFICINPLCKTFKEPWPGGEGTQAFVCKECGRIRERLAPPEEEEEERCRQCGGTAFEERLNSSLVLNLDVQLISARHLYRMPYSMHEKSGLVSLPIDPHRVLSFEREEASPDRIGPLDQNRAWRFLDRETAKQGEAALLLREAKDHWASLGKPSVGLDGAGRRPGEVDIPPEAVPESAFPPCMQIARLGLRDGRKRFLFSAVNFLHSVGWPYERIEAWLKEWNAKNPEPLSETLVVGQVRYHREHQKRVLPPNCDNQHYYVDIGICKPDELCRRIRNPASYAMRKVRFVKKDLTKKETAQEESQE